MRFVRQIRRVTARLSTFALIGALAFAQEKQAPDYTFRVNSDLVLVNVTVRDKAGNLVRDLTAEDFSLQEDGKEQQIQSFDIQSPDAPQTEMTQATVTEGSTPLPKLAATKRGSQEVFKDKRLIVLFFDLSAMEEDEIDRAVKSAIEYVDKQMTASDLVAVVTLGDSMRVAQDFTIDKQALKNAVARINPSEGQGFQAADTSTDTGAQFIADDSEYNVFNSDRRLQAISALAESLSHFQQKKSVLYFSGGLERTGLENQSQLRATINTAVRANVALYTVDSRGLQALPPGGDATRGSVRGASAYSGAAVQADLDSNFSSQETLVTLATDTGGKAFLDSNDFAPAYKRVQTDTSSYYLIGYRSSNKAMDGRFRRITVKVNRKDLKLDFRKGYYAPRDFAHSTKADREQELEDELMADLPRTDLPVYLETAYFRMQEDRFYVPVSIVIPGSAIPVRGNKGDKTTAVFDIIGLVREEATKFPVGNVRDTVKVGIDTQTGSVRCNVQYSTGFDLAPGKYVLKFVVRDNQDGRIGSFETNVVVPNLKKSPLRMSSVVLSSQSAAPGKEKKSPLIQDGKELLPNVAHVFGTDQSMTVFFEVYDPARAKSEQAKQEKGVRVLTALQFYAGKIKVFETPLVESSTVTNPDRKATALKLDVPLKDLKPGWYTCQLSVIDDANGSFAFPRFVVRVDQRQ
jgi:VWFA-related protein